MSLQIQPFPRDILCEITQYIKTPNDINSLALTCRDFRQTAEKVYGLFRRSLSITAVIKKLDNQFIQNNSPRLIGENLDLPILFSDKINPQKITYHEIKSYENNLVKSSQKTAKIFNDFKEHLIDCLSDLGAEYLNNITISNDLLIFSNCTDIFKRAANRERYFTRIWPNVLVSLRRLTDLKENYGIKPEPLLPCVSLQCLGVRVPSFDRYLPCALFLGKRLNDRVVFSFKEKEIILICIVLQQCVSNGVTELSFEERLLQALESPLLYNPSYCPFSFSEEQQKKIFGKFKEEYKRSFQIEKRQ